MTFEEVVRAYQAAMMRWALVRCRNGQLEPEEVVQEAWLEIWRMWDRIEQRHGFAGLLRYQIDRAANRMWRDRTHTKKRRGETVPIDDLIIVAPADQEVIVEARQTVRRLAELPLLLRRPLIDRALGDEVNAIAAREGVTHQAITNRISRARQKLLA